MSLFPVSREVLYSGRSLVNVYFDREIQKQQSKLIKLITNIDNERDAVKKVNIRFMFASHISGIGKIVFREHVSS